MLVVVDLTSYVLLMKDACLVVKEASKSSRMVLVAVRASPVCLIHLSKAF